MTRFPVRSRLSTLVAACLFVSLSAARADDQMAAVVDAEGNISLPADFRATMTHLGSWFVPQGDASGFHDVYADAEAVAAYRRTGAFPDGSVLVKELRSHEAGTYTTGAGVAHATESLKQWFVMVKDAKGRFPGNPSWGDGWGWALFKPDAPERSVVTNYQADCLGCHAPARAKDWVYVEGYPTLTTPR